MQRATVGSYGGGVFYERGTPVNPKPETLNQGGNSDYELAALECLIEALFKTKGIDELEPLLPRYRSESVLHCYSS